ncbi:EF-P lysine aminoacylase GenX [Candidatus Gottesmanbacteria bacterium RIFCSPLOWO2_01_FULL_43_11b]|uniref:EF-P lysine aminoacylase GenX n=1 Tax=Candidatus Gottesmanbacteria bacterium RIFCSPLOWO2_01_FULL_43_11b TaxID=1798392 RepID=A0A1F6AH50_9BACT|nr:MAG: EF-P lysine aminoacylase GenX [Candidatus Gottesmanbacteria bacterium RIFCSPLOWO2_01_FULL_43_11b]
MKTWQKLRKNPDLWDRYFIREKVITAIRTFFGNQGFHEVETPLLTGSLPPESYVDVFETTLLDRHRKPTRAFLPTSPEPFLKKLLVAGIGNCFSITKSFRNTESQSKTHNPEFTILEWYRVGATYTDIMKDCEELLLFINTYLLRSKAAKGVIDTKTLMYQGKKVSLSSPWERMTITQAFKKYAKLNLEFALTEEKLLPIAKEKGYAIGKNDNWEEVFLQIFLNEVEPHLGRGKPTIVYDYPVILAALSKKKKSDPRLAERFEFYIEGLELGDAYSELTDWKEQKERFESEERERIQLGKISHPIDTDFIDALKVGMPETGGIAVGVDRLIMLFADVSNIADTLFFPAADLFEK